MPDLNLCIIFVERKDENMKKGTLEYWKRRCELAEDINESSPCNQYITGEHRAAHRKYNDFIKETDRDYPLYEWIDVNAMLPPIGKRVMVNPVRGKKVLSTLKEGDTLDPFDRYWQDDDGNCFNINTVIEWMDVGID